MPNLNRRTWLVIGGTLLAAVLAFLLRRHLALLLRLAVGGALIACALFPLCQWFSVRLHLSRIPAILCAYVAVAALLALVVVLFLPPLIGQIREIITLLPAFTETVRGQARSLNSFLSEHGLNPLKTPEFDLDRLLSSLPPLLGGTASFAGSVAGAFTEATLMLMLGYYFLRDRERLLLHLELAVPTSHRRSALRMAASIRHEIATYLRGQLLISAIVALLSAFGLMLAGVRAFLALGLIVGIFNMIPYFGPLLGAIPAVLMALTQGLDVALFAALALFAVQQLDGMVISPRVMGAMTGLHPALVLIAITVGGSLHGVIGMLLAIPFVLAARAASRVWVSRAEAN